MTITARSVRSGGGRVLLVESGAGRPVVLLHGLGGTFRYWLGTVSRLAGQHRMIAADVPGFGGSDVAARPFDPLAAGLRVLEACEAIGAERPVLVGHSLAGPIAACVAARVPERVGGVVLVSSASLSRQRAWRRHALVPVLRVALRHPRSWENLLAGNRALRRVVFREMFVDPGAVPAAETRMLVGGASLARQIPDALESTLAFDLEELLPALSVPLGIVWGDLDRTAPFTDVEIAVRLRPDAALRIVHGAGHMLMLERPDAFAEALGAVLPDQLTNYAPGVAYVCERCGGEVDLARTPLESGLVRLAALGADGFELEFDDPRVHAAAERALGSCPHVSDPSWQAAELAPLADAGWRALIAADDDELETLAMVWRPRALTLAGRGSELSRDDIVRGRLEQRVAQVSARMQEALDAGDEDEAERLHARAIELGTVLAGRLAAEWRT